MYKDIVSLMCWSCLSSKPIPLKLVPFLYRFLLFVPKALPVTVAFLLTLLLPHSLWSLLEPGGTVSPPAVQEVLPPSLCLQQRTQNDRSGKPMRQRLPFAYFWAQVRFDIEPANRLSIWRGVSTPSSDHPFNALLWVGSFKSYSFSSCFWI